MTDVLTVNMPLSLSYPEEEASPEPSAELQQLQGNTAHSNARVKRFTAKNMWF